jgi:hypothetical protein
MVAHEAVQEENVAELLLGPEFSDIHILSNAQVAVVLQVSADSAVTRDEELNEVYRQTQRYTSRFNTMTNPEKPHQEIVEELDNLQEYVLCRLIVRLTILIVAPWLMSQSFPIIILTLEHSLPFGRKRMTGTNLNCIAMRLPH